MKLKTISLILEFLFAAGQASSFASKADTAAEEAKPGTLLDMRPVASSRLLAAKSYTETQNGDIIDQKSGFEYNILDDGAIELRAYTGRAKELVIPKTLNGKKVTSLDFFGGMLMEPHLSSTVAKLVVPDSVVRIASGKGQGRGVTVTS